MSWEIEYSTIGDFGEVVMGMSPKGDTYNEEEEGLPLLNGPTEFGSSHPIPSLFTTDSKRESNVGDLIFCVRGSTTGRMNWANQIYSLGRGVCAIRGKTDSDTKYIKYVLDVKLNSLLNIAGGGTFPNLKKDDIKDFEIPILKEKDKLVSIISAYDDLIENNLKRIKLLEQAAQNIYKEWFVNLRFPGHENTPINEETGLPEGWKIGVISDFGKVVTGKTPSTKRSDFYGGHIPFIKTPDMHGLPYVIETSNNLTELGQQAQLNKNIPANSVLVSCIGTAGVVAMTSKLSQTNQQINSVVFESTFKGYYFYCFAKTLRPLLEGLGSNGATMVNVNKGKFENVDLNIPIEDLLVEYAKIAEPMFNQMLILSIQNQKLKAGRNILLPRLMNRTIEV